MERSDHSKSPWLQGGSHDNELPAPYSVSTIVKSISLMITICAGAVENTIIIYTVIKDKRLHRAPYYFIINLCIGDLLRSVLCLPLVLDAVLHGSIWRHSMMGCKLLAFSNTFLTFGTAFAIFILAIDRHLSVVYHRFHARKFRGIVMCLLIVLLGWALAFLLAFPPVFGLGTYSFNRMEAQCTFDHRYYTDNDTLAFSGIFLASLILSVFVYIRIFHFLRRHRKMYPVLYRPPVSASWTFRGAGGNVPQMNNLLTAGISHDTSDLGVPGGPLTPLQNQTTFTTHSFDGNQMTSYRNEHLTKAAFIASCLYIAMWLPYIIVSFWYMFDISKNIPWMLVTIATWLTYCQVAAVAMTYLFYHKPFRLSMSNSMSQTSSASHSDYVLTENA